MRYNFYYFEVARFASVRFVAFRSEYYESQWFGPKRDATGLREGVGEGCGMGDVSVGGEVAERERVGVKGGLDGWRNGVGKLGGCCL